MQIGKTPLALIRPNFPDEILHVWENFIEISSTRSPGFNGPLPITYQEIKSWQELTQTPLAPWEVKAIKKLDNIYIRVVTNGRS
jgi:hypothetical protein